MPTPCNKCSPPHRTNGAAHHLSNGHAAPIAATAWSRSLGKAAFDRLVAWMALVVLSPVLLLLVILVRLTSRGPAVFRQKRVGRNGRIFTLYKLRTMRIDAEANTGAVWAEQHDPRCTSLGRWMRHLHLDELPQLVNVLTGDMSLVGPRPERPEFVVLLAAEIPHYLDRHAVHPGITGLAQILLPPDHEVADVRRKLSVDLHFARHCGFWLDFRLLAFTGLRLLRVPVSLCDRLAPLPALAAIPVIAPLVTTPVQPRFEPEFATSTMASFAQREFESVTSPLPPPMLAYDRLTPSPEMRPGSLPESTL